MIKLPLSTTRLLKVILTKIMSKFWRNYIKKDYVKILEKSPETESKKCYLPHFAVIKPDKETTKTIIIFDVSAVQDGRRPKIGNRAKHQERHMKYPKKLGR